MKEFELFWAKKKTEEHGEIYHPLLFHTFDVGVVARELWRTGLHKAIRHFFMAELGLSEQETIAWLSFLIALHDTGKASPAFIRQDQKAREALQKLEFSFRPVNEKCPHGIITAYVLADLLRTVSGDNNFPQMFGRALGIAVGGHHGTFSGDKAGPRQRGTQQWENARKGLAEELARLFQVPLASLPNYSQNHAFYVLLAGLTCVADWIGSNEEHFLLRATGDYARAIRALRPTASSRRGESYRMGELETSRIGRNVCTAFPFHTIPLALPKAGRNIGSAIDGFRFAGTH